MAQINDLVLCKHCGMFDRDDGMELVSRSAWWVFNESIDRTIDISDARKWHCYIRTIPV